MGHIALGNLMITNAAIIDGIAPSKETFDENESFLDNGEARINKYMLAIKEDGSIYPGTESTDNDQARARFAAGDIGMKTAGSYDYGVLTSQFPANCDWGVAPYPTAVAGERKTQHMGNYGYLMINKKSADEKAEKILGNSFNDYFSNSFVFLIYGVGFHE